MLNSAFEVEPVLGQKVYWRSTENGGQAIPRARRVVRTEKSWGRSSAAQEVNAHSSSSAEAE